MTLLPELETALVSGARRNATVRRRQHAQMRAGVLIAGALLMAGAALAATGGWPPHLGTAHHRVELSTTSVPPHQAATLGVLRRPQRATDRGRDVLLALRGVPDSQMSHGVRLSAVRRLAPGPSAAGAVILVPEVRFGEGSASSRRRQVHDAVCLIFPETLPASAPVVRAAAVGCWTTAAIRADKAKMLGRRGDTWHLIGLVPDGVAKVVVARRDGKAATVPVRDNYYDVPGRPSTDESAGVRSASTGAPPRWLDRHGRDVTPRR